MFNRKKAFTLSEVLIALTIIGVVAALTVPMLMSDTTAKTNRLKVQKAYTTLASALSIGESRLEYNMADISGTFGVGASEYTIENFLTKTMNVTRLNTNSHPFAGKMIDADDSGSVSVGSYGSAGIASSAAIFKAQDGTYYIFPQLKERTNIDGIETVGCEKSVFCVGYIDINGPEGPNELITCTSGADAYPYYDYTNKQMVSPAPCTVDKSAYTDIYPFIFYGGTIKPAINAFDTVLTTDVKD